MSYRSEKEVRTHVALRGFDESFIQGEGNCEPSLVENGNDDGTAIDHMPTLFWSGNTYLWQHIPSWQS
jgi:hypothetical protein